MLLNNQTNGNYTPRLFVLHYKDNNNINILFCFIKKRDYKISEQQMQNMDSVKTVLYQ